MHKRHWWKILFGVVVAGIAGVMVIGVGTYRHAPPIPTFVDGNGAVVIDKSQIIRGQIAFQRLALMEYGSMFGDGAMRGPDFTADALHSICVAMIDHHLAKGATHDEATAQARRELRANTYAPADNTAPLTAAQIAGYRSLPDHITSLLAGDGVQSQFKGGAQFGLVHDEQDRADLCAFFFWGAWVCSAERPGTNHSYTHNWPFDPLAGNQPTSEVLLWSVWGSLGLMICLGWVLYWVGRFGNGADATDGANGGTETLATTAMIDAFRPTPTQRAAYKYFTLAAALFVLQVIAGILTVHDFVGLTTFWGVAVDEELPITIVRSWHVQIALFWITSCWIGATVFVLPMMAKDSPHREPRGQLALVNTLFVALVVLVLGSIVGIYLGPKGLAGEWWRWFGHQGWEFVEFGRAWQVALLVGFVLWATIIYRGIGLVLRERDWWSLPNWMLYSVVAISLLYLSSFVANPQTNFVIADFWRWCVIHMWVEAFFEVFTTVIVAFFMCLMGFVSVAVASRVVFIATILFLGSGILGISHNFYWNAKPVAAIALGSVFSTLQVVPLILLTLEARKFRRLPAQAIRSGSFALEDAFLFLIAVNFWNFMGAGVFGFIINLPIVNYYEHGTYLTVNHGHAALMGVYGNLSLAAILFCARYLVDGQRWNGTVNRIAFWSLNLGLALMVLLDLFPAGVLQLGVVLEQGLWAGRSQEFIQGDAFQTLTWLRAIGGPIFVVGGVTPIAWFVMSRARWLKR